MPSFAKLTVEEPTNPLLGVWKDNTAATTLSNLVDARRTRTAEIIGMIMPSKIAHLQQLIQSENDESSPLWIGQIHQGDFKQPRMIQPHSAQISPESGLGLNKGDLEEGEKVVLPSDICSGGLAIIDGIAEEDDADSMPKRASDGHSSDNANGTTTAQSAASANVDANAEQKAQTPLGIRAGSHWFEVVPRNKIQYECLQLTLKECEDLHMLVMDLRVWLELEIPLIEDGNSFGADVQNHLIRELDTAYKKANMFINANRNHHTDRIKLINDWVKYPNALDYPAAIAASDRFDHLLARSHVRNLLLTYGGLMTKFQRNWEKVIDPKGVRSGSGGSGIMGVY